MPKPNPAQKLAIEQTEGPVMLLAGPGTGKTFTLIKRVEKILEKGALPESILCLTFSEAASSEIKTRLVEKIGAKAGGVNAATYHSFCMDILRRYPEEFEISQNVQMADDVTKQAILKECIDEFEIEFLKDKWGNKYYYILSILSGIETIKRERTSKKEYFELLDGAWQDELNDLRLELKEREKNGKATITCAQNVEKLEKKLGKAREFYSIFEIYKRKLNENGLIDYSDMINFVLDKVEGDEKFAKNVFSDFKYVLVDEYQDTSRVQNDLIFNILKGASCRNIFVVGDDDQIIYSFQGARTSNLSDFLEKFKDTKVIALEENRRSTQIILDFASALIQKDNFRLPYEKKLVSKNENLKEEKIKFNIYPEVIQEENSVTDEIEKLVKNGTKLSEIAIITRKNDQLENYARLLYSRGIPFILSKQKNAFEIPSFIQTYFYLKILVNPYISQDKIIGLLSFAPFKIKDETLSFLFSAMRRKGGNLFDYISEFAVKYPDLKNFLDIYIELKAKKNYTQLLPFIYETITKTGILKYYSNIKENVFENISGIQRLIDEAVSYNKLHKGSFLLDFIRHLDTYFTQNIKIEIKKDINKKEAVQLLTYHGSKGREFEHVFLPNLTAGAFEKASPGNRELALPVAKSQFSSEKGLNKDAELLRLLYVGITRAKQGLYLSYSNAKEGCAQVSSKYISNLFPSLNYLVEQNIFETDSAIQINEIVKNIKTEFGLNFINEIQERTENLVISPASLNKYLNCPLQYLYSDILKIPVFVEDRDVLSYGSSVHAAIEYMTKKAIQNGVWGTLDEMIEKFENAINEEEFSTPDKKQDFTARGYNSIKANFAKFTESSPSNILSTEYRMELEFEGHILKGFADRISKDNEGNIYICDFKTGSYKKAENNENYYNQLRFYKFMYEKLNEGARVKDCSLIFFEEGMKPSSAGCDVTNNEEIKEKIRKAAAGIKALDFSAKKSADNCKFCNYRLICNLYNQ